MGPYSANYTCSVVHLVFVFNFQAEQCKEEGNKCVKENKFTEAVIHYTEAIKHEPNAAVLYSNRSLAFVKIDQLFFALEDAQKAIKLDPSWPKV